MKKQTIKRAMFHVKQFYGRWYITFSSVPLSLAVYIETGFCTSISLFVLFMLMNVIMNTITKHFDDDYRRAVAVLEIYREQMAEREKKESTIQ